MYPLTRLRRTRMYKWSRNIVKENVISSSDLILPIFIKEGKKKEEEISSMPDVYKYSIDNLEKIAFESELRTKLITLGLKQSLKFSWKNCANETLSVYKKLI